jgi:predicted ATPase
VSFHGRQTEIADALASNARVLTIIGPGGMGKTRLAQRIADALGDAWFCDLVDARSENDVLSTIARALDIPLVMRGAEPREQVGDSIAARERVHLILDNCEQVVDDVARIVRQLLDRAPTLRVIATSRERLRITGEEVLELKPLSTDDGVSLFVDRARLVQPALDAVADRSVIESIVATLDGIPLAIELAAARMGVLSASALLDRLTRGLDVLAGRTRDGADRQRTMRAAIDWSWNNLTDDEQRALRAVSAFRGGFDVAAAEAVIGEGALDLVESLRDKSMIRTFPVRGELRLGLYQPIRAYAQEKLLAAAEEDTIAARHAAHFAAMTFPPDALVAIEREAENLTAVSERALREDTKLAFDQGAAALLAREPLGLLRGPLARWREAVDALLARPHAASSSLRARLVLARGRARQLLGETADARADAESLCSFADASIAARASWQVASIAGSTGDYATARAYYEQALATLDKLATRTLFDRETEAMTLGNLGTVLRDEAELVAAREHHDRALAVARDAGLRRLSGQYLGDLAAVLHMAGDLEASARAFGDAISVLESVGDRRMRALFLGARALVLQERGDLNGARADLDRAIAAQTLVGDRRYLGYLRGCRAQVDHEQDRLEDAERQYREAIATLREVKNVRVEGLFLGGLGALLARRSKRDEARACFARAEELLRSVDDRIRLAAVHVHQAHLEEERAAVLARLAEGREHVAHSDDVRFAIRLAERIVADTGSDALIVALDGSSFRPPRGALVDVSKKLSAKRLLAALADARLNTPGRSLSTATLFAAGWPGERAKESSAANRVYVALASLRTLGLRSVLQSGDDGYRLDPSVPLLTASV